MKVFKYLIILFLTVSLNADIDKEYYVGIGIYNYDNVYKNRIKKIILKLANKLEKSYEYKVNLIFLDDESSILDDFKSYKKMNLLINYLGFYLKNKEILKDITKKPFLFNNNENRRNQFYLLVNKKSNINSLKDLKGKSFASFVGDEGFSIWLDYLTIKNLNKSYKKVIEKEYKVQKKQRLVLDLYFNKADFSVVSKTIYDDMLLLNPSIKKRVKVLKKSKQIFFFSLGLFHKSMPDDLADIFYKYIGDGKYNEDFSELFKLVNAYGMQQITFEELKDLDDFYREYKKLKEENR